MNMMYIEQGGDQPLACWSDPAPSTVIWSTGLPANPWGVQRALALHA